MANAIFLNTSREDYSIEPLKDCTLTVGELKLLLCGYDESDRVYFRNDGGYTFGSLNDVNTLQECDEDSDEWKWKQ